MSKPTNWILATALLGLPAAAGIAASDEPYEIVEPVPEEPQCGDVDDIPTDELEALGGLIEELRCVFDADDKGWRWIRLCYTNPAGNQS